MTFSEGNRLLGTKKSGFMDQLPNIGGYKAVGRL